MIVFIDQANRKVDIYKNDGVISVPFHQSWRLKTIATQNEPIIYVTDCVKTTMGKIIDTVDSIRGFSAENQSGQGEVITDEPLMIHTTGREYLNMPGIETMFMGLSNFYPVANIKAKYGDDIFEKDTLLKAYLKNGKLEILPISEMKKITDGYKDPAQERIDRQLSNMIIDGKVEDFIDGGGDDEDSAARDNAMVIDLGKTGRFGGGGSTENEGQLLPEDF